MLDRKGIEAVIPHRGKMLLLDEIREYTDISGVGVHYVNTDEFWCDGHFPSNPIMPGVLQVESLAQTACFVALNALGTDAKKIGYFTTMEKIRFSHFVRPGDKLELFVEQIGKKMALYKFHGIAMVGGQKVCEATFTAMMNDVE